jgi:hypothetical protein
MRFVFIIVAASMILGLAALGLVAAQKEATPTATAASTVHVAAATRNVPGLPARSPVSQIAPATDSETQSTAGTTPSRPSAALPAAAPPRLAQTMPAQTPSTVSATEPTASAQNKPAGNIPGCDKQGGMAAARYRYL